MLLLCMAYLQFHGWDKKGHPIFHCPYYTDIRVSRKYVTCLFMLSWSGGVIHCALGASLSTMVWHVRMRNCVTAQFFSLQTFESWHGEHERASLCVWSTAASHTDKKSHCDGKIAYFVSVATETSSTHTMVIGYYTGIKGVSLRNGLTLSRY